MTHLFRRLLATPSPVVLNIVGMVLLLTGLAGAIAAASAISLPAVALVASTEAVGVGYLLATIDDDDRRA